MTSPRTRRAALDLLAGAGVDQEEALIAVGDPLSDISRLAAEHDAALVVVGSRRRGALSTPLLGSGARDLARSGVRPCSSRVAASCPTPQGRWSVASTSMARTQPFPPCTPLSSRC
jgi:hypothetical protein